MRKLECLDGLNGGGWGVFIAPTTNLAVAVDGHTGQSGGAPDTPLFTIRWVPHISRPLGFEAVDRWSLLSSCGTEQSSATCRPRLPSDFLYCWLRAQSTVGRSWLLLRCLTGQSGGTPDSPMNFSGQKLRKPESSQFARLHQFYFAPIEYNFPKSFSLYVYVNFMHLRKTPTRQTS
jgi:hypothetical protein